MLHGLSEPQDARVKLAFDIGTQNNITSYARHGEHTTHLKLSISESHAHMNGWTDRQTDRVMRPDSLLRLWHYINHLLTYLRKDEVK